MSMGARNPGIVAMRAWARSAWAALIFASTAFAMQHVHAHPGDHNSVSVVLRDAGHCVLTLQFDVRTALHKSTQPAMPTGEWLIAYSSMAPQAFEQAWARATREWAAQNQLVVNGIAIAAVRWSWPRAADAQALLREQVMHALTGGDSAAVRRPPGFAQAQADFRIADLAKEARPALRMHGALQPLHVTSYRTHQQWMAPDAAALPLRF